MDHKYNIILASKSPRRAEILRMIGVEFDIIPSNIKEIINKNVEISKIVETISYEKAEKIAQMHPNDIVIGADTIVSLKGEIFEKPIDVYESKRMLMALSGTSHEVITGVTLIKKSSKIIKTFSETTKVYLREIPKNEIEYYINNFNTLDKAGSYGIQEWFSVWIQKINGCYYNVMGLPISKFYMNFINLKKLVI